VEADAHLHYRATTKPGARLPHARLERNTAPISTLDLVDGLGFALLTGPGGQPWAHAAAEVSSRLDVPITVHVIGRGTGALADPYGEWAAVREVESDGCVLVRPDRHVAWRYPRFDAAAAQALGAGMERILARAESLLNVPEVSAIADAPALAPPSRPQPTAPGV
jgi:2,4-dichlorophenol 6-monooxygenase